MRCADATSHSHALPARPRTQAFTTLRPYDDSGPDDRHRRRPHEPTRQRAANGSARTRRLRLRDTQRAAGEIGQTIHTEALDAFTDAIGTGDL
jgi:hypothetical protein